MVKGSGGEWGGVRETMVGRNVGGGSEESRGKKLMVGRDKRDNCGEE